MAGVLVAAREMCQSRRIRIAHDDSQLAVDRREHEARGNEGAKAECSKNPLRGPRTRATVGTPDCTAVDHALTMHEGARGIKCGVPVYLGEAVW